MPFDVRKHLIKVQGQRDYLPVASRLVWFREEHPTYGVDTKPLHLDTEKGLAVFQARIFNDEGVLLATGTKMETARGFADYAEKAETGAIGRALGVLGFGTQFAPEFDEGDRLADTPRRTGGTDTPEGPGTASSIERGAKEGHSQPTAGQAVCDVCGTNVSKAQATVSEHKYSRVLCPAHQAEAKNA